MNMTFEWYRTTIDELRVRGARLDADTLSPGDARTLVQVTEDMKRAIDAIQTAAIGRVERTGAWSVGKARSTADWVAETTGASWGEAKGRVELAEALHALPDTAAALVEGRISSSAAAQIARAGAVDPNSEYRMLDLAERASHKELKDAAQRVVATASGQAEEEQAAVHRTRYLRTWIDREGAFRIDAKMTKAEGAKVLAVLEPLMEIEFTNARRQGRREQPDAYRADALVVMAERAEIGSRAIRRARAAAKARGATSAGESVDGAVNLTTVVDDATPPEVVESDLLADDRALPTPKAHVIVRVDYHALLRGHVEGDETCEIEGIGPVPVSDVEQVMGNAYLTMLRTKGRDVLSATTATRTVRPELQRALEARDSVCVVPGCGIASGLEIDHLIGFAQGGPTGIDNLQRLCKHHHRLKTTGKAQLTRWETKDGPQFGWLPRTAEAEEPPPQIGPGAARVGGRSRVREPDRVEDPGASDEMFPDTGTG